MATEDMMRNITDRDEDLEVKVTSEPSTSREGRHVQISFTHPDSGEYRLQAELTEGERVWLDLPLMLVNGQVRVG